MAELSTIARPYAEALFDSVVSDQGGLESWSELLAGLAQLADHDEVREALTDPRLNDEQRYDLFAGLVKGDMPERAQNLIRLLIDNDRILLLPYISRQFDLLRHQHEGTAQADITSAYPMPDEQLAQLVAGLETKFGLKLKPVVTVDESLIGGVRVVVGDQVLDTSVQAQLARMRDTLVA
ncbi:MAG TPA: F0F1 ATP synthase subunit delta [Burkholderiaceae bacterium]|nr:F0F1 ATP synthase subunit delta [Burkholderiaceae bacterium]